MIGHIRGRLLRKEPGALLVECGGVGYLLHVPLDAFYELEEGREVALHVHTHMREGTIELFGFRAAHELRLFDRLLTVSRVGPRIALSLLSAHRPDELAAAIQAGRIDAIASAPGVGRKTAERIHVELRDKLGDLLPEGKGAAAALRGEVVSALVNLGYSQREASAAAEAAIEGKGETAFEEALRLALRRLGGRG